MLASHGLFAAFMGGMLVVAICLGVFIAARGYERAEQREERHRLKAELAAAKLLLSHHGVEFPEGKQSDS